MHTFFPTLLIILVKLDQVYSQQSIFETTFKLLNRGSPAPRILIQNPVPVKWIQQKLDHFNNKDKRTWKMRYIENRVHFKPGGPLFIFVGGKRKITANDIRGGLIYNIARKHSGYLFATEHRYYGRSLPTKNFNVENLKYSSVDQVLADLAHFIRTVKSTYQGMKKSKVILVGASHSASIVTWFQRKYPGLAVGSWASSGPLLAKVDFKEYKEAVGKSISLAGGLNCYNRIMNAFKEMEILIHKNSSYLMKLFNMCDDFDFNNKLDIWSFFFNMSNFFSSLVQNHNSGDIKKECEEINSKGSDLIGVSSWISKFLSSEACNMFFYADIIESLSNIEAITSSEFRLSMYQKCSEFGWFRTSDANNQPFGNNFPIDLNLKVCKEAYGDRFTKKAIYENMRRTNKIYGGLNPGVTNVIFTYGGLDPWRTLGILESNVVPLYGHCQDFDTINDDDSDEMKASKRKVVNKIEEWLNSVSTENKAFTNKFEFQHMMGLQKIHGELNSIPTFNENELKKFMKKTLTEINIPSQLHFIDDNMDLTL